MISLFVAFTLAVRVSASFKLLGHFKRVGFKNVNGALLT